MPGHFVEHVYHLEKYAFGKCRGGVTTAKGPTPVLERSSAHASLLAHVVVSKHVDHVPLQPAPSHRTRVAERGSRCPTMSDWVRWGGAACRAARGAAGETHPEVTELVRTDAQRVSKCSIQTVRKTSMRGTIVVAMWATSATSCSATRPRDKGRQVPGSSWRVVRDTCRPTPRASSTACSTVRWPPQPKSDVGRMPGD